MKNLRELTTYASLQEISASLAATVGDGETQPEAVPEGEREFVKLHKTARRKDPYGNKGSEAVKEAPYKKAPKNSGFPPEVKEEEEKSDFERMTALRRRSDRSKTPGTKGYKERQAAARRRNKMSKKHPELAEEGQWGVDELGRFRRVDEAAGIARAMAKGANPLIKRPKFDARGNVILTKDAKRNIEYGKAPRSRKLTGTPYSTKKAFGEDKEIDEAKESWFDKHAVGSAGFNRSKRNEAARQSEKRKDTVLVAPKGEKGGGKVSRIPKSQYDPKKHSLAEEQLDEKNWIAGAIKKPGALTRSAKRAGESTTEFAQKHKHEGGKTGKRARLALTLKNLHKEETEPLDEISGYMRNAREIIAGRARESEKARSDYQKKRQSRYGGTAKAAAATAKDLENINKTRKEETKLDELSKPVLGRYISGRTSHLAGAAYAAGHAHATNRPEEGKVQTDKLHKYQTGIKRAAERVGGTFESGKPLRTMIPGKGPNDKASGPYTMKRKQLYHSNEYEPEGEMIDEGGPTKKHFQMAADTIKSIPDEAKRKEHAHAHADLYTKQNPRFDRGKFLKAAGVNEETDKDRYLNKSYKHSRDTEKKRQLRGDMRASNDAYREKIYKARTAQLRKEETLDEVSAPGEETWIKHRKKEGGFQQRYGDRWKNVLYATAWKRSKHNYPKG